MDEKRVVEVSVYYPDTDKLNKHMAILSTEKHVEEYIERMEANLPRGGEITGIFNWPAADRLQTGGIYMLGNGDCIKLEKTTSDGCIHLGRRVNGAETGKARPYGSYMMWWCSGQHVTHVKKLDNPLDIIV